MKENVFSVLLWINVIIHFQMYNSMAFNEQLQLLGFWLVTIYLSAMLQFCWEIFIACNYITTSSHWSMFSAGRFHACHFFRCTSLSWITTFINITCFQMPTVISMRRKNEKWIHLENEWIENQKKEPESKLCACHMFYSFESKYNLRRTIIYEK